jgi:hypothetical protein
LPITLQSFPSFCYGRAIEGKSDHAPRNYFYLVAGRLGRTVWAQSADKAIIAHTSESISLAPGVKNQVAANDLVDFQILRQAAKDIDGTS